MIGRRGILGSGLASIAAAIAGLFRPKPAQAKGLIPYGTSPRRWGMVIDLDRCTACGACTVACQQENNVSTMQTAYGPQRGQIEWMTMLWRESDDPDGSPQMLPLPCLQCEKAPCTKVCPVGATYKDPEGIVAQIYQRCIGCRYCTAACPYTRRYFNWAKPEWEGSLVQTLNPDVATRPVGVVEKCTFCSHRVQAAKERAALEGRGPTDDEVRRLTACAAACPAEAITFGDMKNPKSTVAELARSPRAFRLMEELGTEPAVVYLGRDRRT